MSLRLVRPTTHATSLQLAPRAVGRFGEMREPLEIKPDERFRLFAEQASKTRIPLELAVGLALERGLVLDDARAAGLPPAMVRRTLSARADATTARARLGPGRLNRDYERLLQRRDKSREDRLREPVFVTIPARIYERVLDSDLHASLDAGIIEEAVEWERAALFELLTMTEWAFRTLLVAELT